MFLVNNVAMKATNVDWNDALTLVQVVDDGSFTAAARTLDLPKSSVSRRVSRLEARLGIRLLHRTTRSLTLTAAGQTYYDKASRLVAEMRDMEATVSGMSERPSGPLRVTAPQEEAEELLFSFLKTYPDIRLEVLITDRYVDLVQEGYDVALRGGKPPDPSLTGRLIRRSDFQLLASADYLARHGRPANLTDLSEHDCLILGPKNPTTWSFETPRGTVSVPVRGPLCSNNLPLVLRAVHQGHGIARLPTGGGGFQTQGLEVLLPRSSSSGGGLWLVYPSNKHLAPAARVFLEFASEWEWVS